MATPPDVEPSAPLPVACSLGPEDGPARLLRWQRLHAVAAPVAALREGELEVRYQPGDGVMEELTDLAAAEQECCSFVIWQVTAAGDQPVLLVTAPAEAPDAVESIAVLFGADMPDRAR